MPKLEEPTPSSLKSVRDEDLLRRLSDLVKQSRRLEADVVAHIAEAERRRLHARKACSSMFEYCRRILGLRENEAHLRITVARASRLYPVILEMLGDGRLHLSGIARLAPHLTRESADALLERACGMSHREVRELVAELEPRPDVAPTVRKRPERLAAVCASPLQASPLQLRAPRVESDALLDSRRAVPSRLALAEPLAPARPAVVEPLAPARYQVRFTACAELRDKLERLKALMRSSVPDATAVGSSTLPSARSCSGSRPGASAGGRSPTRIAPKGTPAPRLEVSPPCPARLTRVARPGTFPLR
jgi:hypothetical protein